MCLEDISQLPVDWSHLSETIALNRKARHNYTITDTFEAGLVLTGTEIKSVRAGKVNLSDAYARVEKGEAWLMNAHIAPFEQGNRYNHEPRRDRKLLLHETLAQFVVARNWLSADRAGRIASETRERCTVNIAARSRGDDMRSLVRHLRLTGQLTAGLILRALLSGNFELFDARWWNCRACRRHASPRWFTTGGASLQALLTRAGLPESTFAAFRAALEAAMKSVSSPPPAARRGCAAAWSSAC